MKIDDFLGLLKGVTPTGSGSWLACCPAHGDEHPSMSVTYEDGKILVHCHTGCTAKDIVGALGLEMRDLFEDSAAVAGGFSPGGERSDRRQASAGVSKKSGSHGQFICDYVYHDVDGNALYKASRFMLPSGKKSFQIKHRDGSANGGWVYGLKDAGIPRVVYHLPEVVKSAKSGGFVVIAEGEKDVDNLRALGYTATCNVGGAGKWGYCFPEDWPNWFKGVKGVLVIADNDPATKPKRHKVRGKDEYTETQEPFLVGQKHAWSVRQSLVKAGVHADRVRLMVMPKVGDEHCKDFTDWRDACVRAGIDDIKAAFKAAVRTAAPWPVEWCFTDGMEAGGEATVGEPVAPAEKSGRDTASDSPVEEGEGRFGKVGPRAPGTNSRKIEVEFFINDKHRVGLIIDSRESIRSCYLASVNRVFAADPDGKLVTANVLANLRAWVTTCWLMSRGEFFWDTNFNSFDTCMYIDYGADEARLMRISSNEFVAFVCDMARYDDVDEKKGDLKRAMGLIKQVAISPEYSRGVDPSNMWDRRGDVVYVSSGDGEMYRLKAGAVEKVRNGTDGVVFLRGKTLKPWQLVDGTGADPFTEAEIFSGANWDDKFGQMNVRLWVLNLFACHRMKPILLVTGLAQSGKTRLATGIKEMLGIRLPNGDIDVATQQIEDGDKGQDSFWVTVNDGKVEVFDNFDTKVKWASDALQNASTGGQTKRRTLYKTAELTVLRAKASMILTSNHPTFLTDGGGGMADRMIHIPLYSKIREKSKDVELTADIDARRDEYMTWIVRTVSAALADDKPVYNGVNKRHPDYGVFSVRCGRAFGDESGVIEAMGSSEGAKAVLPLRQDVVASGILEVLRTRSWTWEGWTSAQMSVALCEAHMDDADEAVIRKRFAPVVVGKVLGKYERQFETLMRFSKSTLHGRTVYSCVGLTSIGTVQVGKVEIKADSAETPRGAGNIGLCADGVLSPPSPPSAAARARADDVALFHEREEEKSVEEREVFDGFGDDLAF